MLRVLLIIGGAYLGIGLVALAVLGLVALYRRRLARAVALGAAVQVAIATRRQEAERDAFQRALATQTPPSLARGDFCDVVDAPFNAIVQCVDGETAWCRIVKSQERSSGVLMVELVGPPRPFHADRLRVLAHDFSLTSAS